ncbi:hypothetical protein NYA9BBAC_01217 [Salinibacterium sp. NYA9b]
MRLSTVAPDLTAEISTLGDVSLRDVSRAAATWVLSQVDIDDVRPRVANALWFALATPASAETVAERLYEA